MPSEARPDARAEDRDVQELGSVEATTVCTGRTQRCSPLPIRIVLGNDNEATAAGSARREDVARATFPVTRRVKPAYVPFSVSRRRSSDGSTPCFLANPAPAGVGFPSLSKATEAAGPCTVSSRSSCRAATDATRTAMRRGPPQDAASPRGKPALSRIPVTSAARSRVAPAIIRAGISSQPISMRSGALKPGHRARGGLPRRRRRACGCAG
jgi:hypothetical protein